MGKAGSGRDDAERKRRICTAVKKRRVVPEDITIFLELELFSGDVNGWTESGGLLGLLLTEVFYLIACSTAVTHHL